MVSRLVDVMEFWRVSTKVDERVEKMVVKKELL